jgi:beta-xylosidase
MGSAPAGLRRLAWFAALYVASLGVFAALVYGLRALVRF